MGVGAGPGVSQQALVKAFLAEKPLLRRFWPGFFENSRIPRENASETKSSY